MDPLSNIYDRLFNCSDRCQNNSAPNMAVRPRPPDIEDWLRYWNDADTDIGNLRNFEHWLDRARPRP